MPRRVGPSTQMKLLPVPSQTPEAAVSPLFRRGTACTCVSPLPARLHPSQRGKPRAPCQGHRAFSGLSAPRPPPFPAFPPFSPARSSPARGAAPGALAHAPRNLALDLMQTITRLKPDRASPSARPRCCPSPAPRKGTAERPGWRGRGAAARGESARHGGHRAGTGPAPQPGPRAAHLQRPAATGGDRAGCRGGRSGSSDGTAAAPLHAPRRRSGDGRGGARRGGWPGLGWAGQGSRDAAGRTRVEVRPGGWPCWGCDRNRETRSLWPRKSPRERSSGDCEKRIRGCKRAPWRRIERGAPVRW